MSYTEIFKFNKDGNAEFLGEVVNSHRGALAVWAALEKRYLPLYEVQLSPMFYEMFPDYVPSRVGGLSDDIQEIWNLADDMRLPKNDWIALVSTFDKVLIDIKDLETVIAAFESFDGETSLKEQAEILKKMRDDENIIAFGFNQTSINSHTWANYGYEEKNDDYYPYNCKTGEGHFWLHELKDKVGRGNE